MCGVRFQWLTCLCCLALAACASEGGEGTPADGDQDVVTGEVQAGATDGEPDVDALASQDGTDPGNEGESDARGGAGDGMDGSDAMDGGDGADVDEPVSGTAECVVADLAPAAAGTLTEFTCSCVEWNLAGNAQVPPSFECRFVAYEDELHSGQSEEGLCTLPSDLTQKGMVLTCSVWLDGTLHTTSSPAVVVNTPPETPVVSVVPAQASLTEPLTCNVVSSDVDPGDIVTYELTWLVNGFENTAATSAVVQGGFLFKDDQGTASEAGDEVQCRAIVTDGEIYLEPADSNIVLMNAE